MKTADIIYFTRTISNCTTVGCPIPSFPNNITFMISNSKVHVELPTNFTRIGSEIQLFCGNQTNQKSASPVFTAICGGNGTWSPNLSHGHIQCMEDKQIGDGKFNIASWFT